MKDAYYFSHDSNARNDEKILMLRAEHGWEGYGIYWALVETMFESSDTCIFHDKVKGIAVGYNIDITLLEDVINTSLEEGLFVSDGNTFWSESLRRRKEKYHNLKARRSEAGKKGMAKRWGTDNSVITNDNKTNNSVITNDSKGKERKGKEKKDIIPDEFEKEILSLYPGKKVKATRDKKLPKILKEYSEEEIIRCISRYSKEVEGTDKQYILNESTFWNGRYMDYLDKNYEEKEKPPRRNLKLVIRDDVL